ncbi:RNA polymerase sigma-70 factor (ECF subfamily) [Bisgaardia hudsonensis]|uniref:RNA polymerase sigma-70 factor (ECF subfamily) n=1 Tax=Bisgaardia hudsonensis TaxID=109472 RepID=A0A4V2SJ75_9PAST|nr:sigma-70 family RNA polymerase sigma factor [Bisgaardia hudsonensis]QLB13093.1 RNA polymerase subunit sigma [Bisgaardia hudsonensis]TCP13341.1 RNA polymerase sigma-70 factor (ECF subfamily) [Bisgaardia hudsonensis]
MKQETLNCISFDTIEIIRKQMLHFTILQIRDPHIAEDLVQDAFVNACKYTQSFRGESSLKTWMFAILKNKIVDFLRSNKKTVALSELEQDDDQDLTEKVFDQRGEWDQSMFSPSEWQSTENTAYSEEFWRIFDFCLNNLPPLQARVFMMRSYLELDTEHICRECDISTTNLYTNLYRARLQLQVCLSQKWFGG